MISHAFNESIYYVSLSKQFTQLQNDFERNVYFVSGTSGRNRSPSTIAMELFEQHQGTHILQVSNFTQQKC